VLLKVGDDVSTDEIMPAGAQILPLRSNIPAISRFVFSRIDANYPDRVVKHRISLIVGGENYGQGSSREHAALAPRYLGVRAVLAKSYARIHWQNLVNFGILPLRFTHPDDWKRVQQGDVLAIPQVREAIQRGAELKVENRTQNEVYEIEHALTPRQVEVILEGSLINVVRRKHRPQ
jgi:aconitate hydratase